MCNLVLSVLVVRAIPVLWKAVSKSFVELWKGILEVGPWVKRTTDKIAREAVAELLNDERLSPSNTTPVYWIVRVISFLVILYGFITAINFLLMFG
jgi:hypothetical protein